MTYAAFPGHYLQPTEVRIVMVDVIVVGAGPVGMMVAAELTLGGVDVVVAERRPTTELVRSRLPGFRLRLPRAR